MTEPWENPDADTSYWDVTTQEYSSESERSCEGQTLDEPWEYYTDDYGYTKTDESQMTGYKEARIADVKRIQQALVRATYNPGPIDGLWGPKTCSAVLAFQKSKFGTAKNSWLDIETWVALGFDLSSAKKFEDLYGMSCGGVPPAGWTGAGSGTNVAVSLTDIQKAQYAMGVLTTGQLDKATCEALFKKQAALGVSGSKLTSKVFETLGFTTSEAQKMATQLASGCASYYTTAGTATVNPQPKSEPATGPVVEPSIAPVEPSKAGFGWLVFGGILVAGLIGYVANKRK